MSGQRWWGNGPVVLCRHVSPAAASIDPRPFDRCHRPLDCRVSSRYLRDDTFELALALRVALRCCDSESELFLNVTADEEDGEGDVISEPAAANVAERASWAGAGRALLPPKPQRRRPRAPISLRVRATLRDLVDDAENLIAAAVEEQQKQQ